MIQAPASPSAGISNPNRVFQIGCPEPGPPATVVIDRVGTASVGGPARFSKSASGSGEAETPGSCPSSGLRRLILCLLILRLPPGLGLRAGGRYRILSA